jgi:hypothetical protein
MTEIRGEKVWCAIRPLLSWKGAAKISNYFAHAGGGVGRPLMREQLQCHVMPMCVCVCECVCVMCVMGRWVGVSTEAYDGFLKSKFVAVFRL